MTDSPMIKVTLTRSAIGSNQRQRQTLRALGLTRVGKTAVVRDNPPNRGRVRTIQHLVDVES
jgi:large subunit ribosomal protein L30